MLRIRNSRQIQVFFTDKEGGASTRHLPTIPLSLFSAPPLSEIVRDPLELAVQIVHHHEAGFSDHLFAFDEQQQSRNGEDGEFARYFRDIVGVGLDRFDGRELLQHLLHLRLDRMADAAVRPGYIDERQLVRCDEFTDLFY